MTPDLLAAPAQPARARRGGPRLPVGYVLRRIGQAVLVVWAAFTLSWVILYLLPGDPVAIMIGNTGEQTSIDPAQVAALRAQYHLDDPVIVQYGIALWRALQGDLGRSIQTGQPVSEAIASALPHTAAVSAAAFAVALVVGTAIAVGAVHSRSSWLRSGLLALPALGMALPTFWIGLLLLQLFSFKIRLFPAMGNASAAALVLPALTLAVPTTAVVAQILARSLLSEWTKPYIDAIRVKGVGRWGLVLRHALRNGALPALTMAGVTVGNLLAGSVVTETVFSRDGLGRLAEQGVAGQDVPVVAGVVLSAALVFVAVNLVVDLVYPLLDPRIRAVGGAS